MWQNGTLIWPLNKICSFSKIFRIFWLLGPQSSIEVRLEGKIFQSERGVQNPRVVMVLVRRSGASLGPLTTSEITTRFIIRKIRVGRQLGASWLLGALDGPSWVVCSKKVLLAYRKKSCAEAAPTCYGCCLVPDQLFADVSRSVSRQLGA